MRNLSITSFYTILIIATIIIFYLSFASVNLPGDVYVDGNMKHTGLLHGLYFLVLSTASTISFISIIVDLFNELEIYEFYKKEIMNKKEEEEVESSSFKLSSVIKILVILFLLIVSYVGINNVVSSMVNIYNKSVIYKNDYTQLTQEKLGFYDKMWKTYSQKDKITNLNRETFIIVTKLIMDSRRDGQSVAWKWVQENQQIPYSEFTKFYADLSSFINTQREEYFSIEKKCQSLANENNTMLDTFPNNLYNRFLKCEHIKFEYGFLSGKTNKTFSTKEENTIF